MTTTDLGHGVRGQVAAEPDAVDARTDVRSQSVDGDRSRELRCHAFTMRVLDRSIASFVGSRLDGE